MAVKAFIAQQHALGLMVFEDDFEAFLGNAGEDQKAAWSRESRTAVSQVGHTWRSYQLSDLGSSDKLHGELRRNSMGR